MTVEGVDTETSRATMLTLGQNMIMQDLAKQQEGIYTRLIRKQNKQHAHLHYVYLTCMKSD